MSMTPSRPQAMCHVITCLYILWHFKCHSINQVAMEHVMAAAGLTKWWWSMELGENVMQFIDKGNYALSFSLSLSLGQKKVKASYIPLCILWREMSVQYVLKKTMGASDVSSRGIIPEDIVQEWAGHCSVKVFCTDERTAMIQCMAILKGLSGKENSQF